MKVRPLDQLSGTLFIDQIELLQSQPEELLKASQGFRSF
jgi:hypothetical protein